MTASEMRFSIFYVETCPQWFLHIAIETLTREPSNIAAEFL